MVVYPVSGSDGLVAIFSDWIKAERYAVPRGLVISACEVDAEDMEVPDGETARR